jgi:hypothetical protein
MTCVVLDATSGSCGSGPAMPTGATSTGSVRCNKADAEAVLAGGQIWATIPTVDPVQDAAQQAATMCRNHLPYDRMIC